MHPQVQDAGGHHKAAGGLQQGCGGPEDVAADVGEPQSAIAQALQLRGGVDHLVFGAVA
jgi:hypothetical protein